MFFICFFAEQHLEQATFFCLLKRGGMKCKYHMIVASHYSVIIFIFFVLCVSLVAFKFKHFSTILFFIHLALALPHRQPLCSEGAWDCVTQLSKVCIAIWFKSSKNQLKQNFNVFILKLCTFM